MKILLISVIIALISVVGVNAYCASGSVNDGIASFTVNSVPCTVTFSSYEHDGDLVPFPSQILVDTVTVTYDTTGPKGLGPLNLACNWQTDLYIGPLQYPLQSNGHYNLLAFDYVLNQVCDEEEIPEFTTIGAGLALAGAGAYMYRRRSRK